jgi:hypothetical protein
MESLDPNLEFIEYYNQVVADAPNHDAMLLENEDAIAFLAGMGELELEGTDIKNGKDLLDYVIAAAPKTPQILLPRGKATVFFTIDNQTPTVIVTANPIRMQTVLNEIDDTILPQTRKVLDALVADYKLTLN